MSKHQERVDILAIARETTIRDINARMPGAIKVIAPAKVNLALHVFPTRSGGYHPVLNVMHTLALHDIVYVWAQPRNTETLGLASADIMSPDIATSPDTPVTVSAAMVQTGDFAVPKVPAASNLACKAVLALAQATKQTTQMHIALRIEKNIPAQAGLGGGSSDAAAALIGAAKLWGIAADDPRLLDVAASLGADVAFFLKGGCALFDGIGEHFVKSYEPRSESLVLIQPDEGLSTAAVYRAFDEAHENANDSLVNAAMQAKRKELLSVDCAIDIPLYNSLSRPAMLLMPDLECIHTWAAGIRGIRDLQLTGSGSATFIVCNRLNDAAKIAGHAKSGGFWARTTSFCNAKVAIVPTR